MNNHNKIKNNQHNTFLLLFLFLMLFLLVITSIFSEEKLCTPYKPEQTEIKVLGKTYFYYQCKINNNNLLFYYDTKYEKDKVQPLFILYSKSDNIIKYNEDVLKTVIQTSSPNSVIYLDVQEDPNDKSKVNINIERQIPIENFEEILKSLGQHFSRKDIYIFPINYDSKKDIFNYLDKNGNEYFFRNLESQPILDHILAIKKVCNPNCQAVQEKYYFTYNSYGNLLYIKKDVQGNSKTIDCSTQDCNAVINSLGINNEIRSKYLNKVLTPSNLFYDVVSAASDGLKISTLLNWKFAEEWRKKMDDFFTKNLFGQIISGNWEKAICNLMIKHDQSTISNDNFQAYITATKTKINKTHYLYKISVKASTLDTDTTAYLLVDGKKVDIDNDGKPDKLDLKSGIDYVNENSIFKYKKKDYKEACLKFNGDLSKVNQKQICSDFVEITKEYLEEQGYEINSDNQNNNQEEGDEIW